MKKLINNRVCIIITYYFNKFNKNILVQYMPKALDRI